MSYVPAKPFRPPRPKPVYSSQELPAIQGPDMIERAYEITDCWFNKIVELLDHK